MADFENQDGDSYRQGLRDSLMSAVEEHRVASPGEEQTGAAPATPAVPSTAETERARDEAGRYAKSSLPAAGAPAKTEATRTASSAAAPMAGTAAPLPAGTAAPAPISPPSSWKKEFHEAFGKLTPEIANYIRQRETEYNTGVSTYRAEAEKAKVLNTALEPFLPAMQQYNVQPADWIRSVGQTHEILLKGSPQQKLQTIMGLARDYGVDLSPLTAAQPQGEGGQPQAQPGQLNPEMAWMRDQLQSVTQQLNSFNQQRQQEQQQAAQQQQMQIQTDIQQFSADTTKYPHFEALRESMARLLESGLAQDLPSAYDQALRLNDELWNSQQESQRQQAEAERQRQASAQVAQARAKVVSVKPATPSGAATTTSTATDRRSQLAEAMQQHGGSRV